MLKIFMMLLLILPPAIFAASNEKSLIDAIQYLATRNHLTIAVSPEVRGITSIDLERTPPADALQLLIHTHGLHEWKAGNVIYISSHAEWLQQQKKELEAQKIAHEIAPLETHIWQIHYANARDLAHLLSGEDRQGSSHSFLSKRGHLRVDTRTNILFIRDTSDRLNDIRAVIHRLDIPVKQVLIHVHLASIDSDFERDLGVHFSQIPSASESPLDHLAIIDIAHGSWLQMRIIALENQGHAELLSNPSLFTANQQTASIESGEEIPYQQMNQNGTTSSAFKKAVLSLRVTPHIMPEGMISLALQVNQDKPSDRLVLGVPAITTRQMSTHILIKSGQTIVLGGIYETNDEQEKQSIPFLGKIPVIGWLFTQRSLKKNKRELLIFVSPIIMS